MKKTMATVAVLGMVAVSSAAFASQGYYGAFKKPSLNTTQRTQQPADSFVTLHNYTSESYTSFAVFENSGKPLDIQLGPYGSGTSVFTYQIAYPDYEVCLNIVRDIDNMSIYNGCLAQGNIDIDYPPAAAGAKKTPKAKVSAQAKFTS